MIEKIRSGPSEIMVRDTNHPHICAFGANLDIAMGRLRTLHVQAGIQVQM